VKKAADLLPRFLARVRGVPRSAPVIAGVSGGIDSVALFDLLQRAGFRKLVVAHFHHGLRGKAADRDADFVRKLAADAGAVFAGGRGQTRARAARKKESIEEAARKLRRAFYARTAGKHDAKTVFLGHHAGDAAETVLFHLARGGGSRGLSSLRERAGLEETDVGVVRPLLLFAREEIEAYAKDRRLVYREDETNTSRAHTRNRLRHDALPALAGAVGHDPVPALARAAEILGAEDDLLEELVRARAQAAQIDTARWRRESLALQRRWLRAWLRAQTGGEIDFETVERAREVALSNDQPAKTNLPRGFHLRRRAGKLFVEKPRRARCTK
jgi:tRNA(Ile)-lysidine synthase